MFVDYKDMELLSKLVTRQGKIMSQLRIIVHVATDSTGALTSNVDSPDQGAKGIVLAGVADGNTSKVAIEALAAAAKSGVLVVRSTRVGSGFVNRNVEVFNRYGVTEISIESVRLFDEKSSA